MYYVYVLKDRNGILYIGRTANLRRRIIEHQNKRVWTTKRLENIKLVFYESFLAKEDSIRRERYLKTSKGKSSLKQIIRDSINI